MTHLLKDPGAVVRYTIAWPPSVLGGASIASAAWAVTPDEPEGIATQAHFIAGGDTGAEFSGGEAGRVYRAACRITLTDGRVDARSLSLRVEER